MRNMGKLKKQWCTSVIPALWEAGAKQSHVCVPPEQFSEALDPIPREKQFKRSQCGGPEFNPQNQQNKIKIEIWSIF